MCHMRPGVSPISARVSTVSVSHGEADNTINVILSLTTNEQHEREKKLTSYATAICGAVWKWPSRQEDFPAVEKRNKPPGKLEVSNSKRLE